MTDTYYGVHTLTEHAFLLGHCAFNTSLAETPLVSGHILLFLGGNLGLWERFTPGVEVTFSLRKWKVRKINEL